MVNPIVSTVAEPDSANQVAQSISQQQRKDPPKEQSDSTENQLSTNNFRNSDPVVEWRNSSEITEMAAELLISPLEVPKEAVTSPGMVLQRGRTFQRLEGWKKTLIRGMIVTAVYHVFFNF